MRMTILVMGLLTSIAVRAGSNPVSVTCIADHDTAGMILTQPVAPEHFLIDYKKSVVTLNGGDTPIPGVAISATNIVMHPDEAVISIDRITGFYKFSIGENSFTGKCFATPEPKF